MINFKSWNTIPKEFIGNCIVENKDSFSRFWLKQGKILHRENGPALIYDCVDKNKSNHQWWINGERHRLDGPAVFWHKINVCHYYVDGECFYNKKEFLKHPKVILNKLNKIIKL